jgi:membrane associated rhomboid family serine protease
MSDTSPRRDVSAAGPLDQQSAIAFVREADALAGRGEYEQAAIYYGRVVGHADPELHVAALLGLSEARYRLDEDEAALQGWIVATQAPETRLSWLAWKRLAEARVRGGDMAGALAAYRQSERRAPPEERPAIASRLGWLTKESGNEREARRHFGRARTDGAFSPIVTYAILAVTVGIGIASMLDGEIGGLFISLFALEKDRVAQGELYRLLSVVLVHDTRLILHLAGNMYALYLVGPIVEDLYGRVRLVAIYLLAAAAGSAASYVLTPADSVGASGAIFGLFGVLFVARRVHGAVLTRQARALTSQIGFLIAFNLVLGFTLGGIIDNAAHVGGLLCGMWLGVVLRTRGATLASMWQRPPGAPAAPGVAPRGAALLARGAGLVVLVAVIAAGILVGTDIRT